jgi:diguanylate cyclase (GGDEF)-like protein
VIGRLGGDEFVLILVSTDRIGAEQLAERVRAAIGTPRIDTVAGPVAVTVSVGVATGNGLDPEELLRNADTALYAAKAAGRDAVATDSRGTGSATPDEVAPREADPGHSVGRSATHHTA